MVVDRPLNMPVETNKTTGIPKLRRCSTYKIPESAERVNRTLNLPIERHIKSADSAPYKKSE
jgi:hypothetical protein